MNNKKYAQIYKTLDRYGYLDKQTISQLKMLEEIYVILKEPTLCEKCNGCGDVMNHNFRVLVKCNSCDGTGEIKDKTDMNNDWKDLDKTAPIDVVLGMGKYQIQLLSDGKWIDTEIAYEIDLLAKLIPGIVKYRYKRKALESIRITREIMDDLGTLYKTFKEKTEGIEYDCENLKERFGRKVEIID